MTEKKLYRVRQGTVKKFFWTLTPEEAMAKFKSSDSYKPDGVKPLVREAKPKEVAAHKFFTRRYQ